MKIFLTVSMVSGWHLTLLQLWVTFLSLPFAWRGGPLTNQFVFCDLHLRFGCLCWPFSWFVLFRCAKLEPNRSYRFHLGQWVYGMRFLGVENPWSLGIMGKSSLTSFLSDLWPSSDWKVMRNVQTVNLFMFCFAVDFRARCKQKISPADVGLTCWPQLILTKEMSRVFIDVLLSSCFLTSASLTVWMLSWVNALVYNHGFSQCEMKIVSFACSHPFMFYKEAAPTFSFLCFSRLHRQALSAEAGAMSTPTNPEVKELNPVDFIQLQQYIECEYRQALNTPFTSTSTYTHTLARGFTYLEAVTVCVCLDVLQIHIHQLYMIEMRVFSSRLQLEGERCAEGVRCRWQSGPTPTRRGEAAAHHQLHSSMSHLQRRQYC